MRAVVTATGATEAVLLAVRVASALVSNSPTERPLGRALTAALAACRHGNLEGRPDEHHPLPHGKGPPPVWDAAAAGAALCIGRQLKKEALTAPRACRR